MRSRADRMITIMHLTIMTNLLTSDLPLSLLNYPLYLSRLKNLNIRHHLILHPHLLFHSPFCEPNHLTQFLIGYGLNLITLQLSHNLVG